MKADFFLVLPLAGPVCVALLPHDTTLVSRPLFGFVTAVVLRQSDALKKREIFIDECRLNRSHGPR